MLEKILIVARTRMKSGVCIGGLTASSSRNVRLIPENRQDKRNYPADTRFDVGQVWDVDYYRSTNIEPPHTEDIIVTDSQYKGQAASLKNILVRRVTPWNGGLEKLFDNSLVINPSSEKCYISRTGPIPDCSTGYWFPDGKLTLYRQNNTKPYYHIDYTDQVNGRRTISIPFVGYANPIRSIISSTLVRVSLARWLLAGSEERCYLQISGFYE